MICLCLNNCASYLEFRVPLHHFVSQAEDEVELGVGREKETTVRYCLGQDHSRPALV